MIKGTTASAREKEKIVFFGKSVRQPFFSWKILSRLRIFSASRWFLQKIMFNRAKRGEMRHPIVQSDTVKTLVECHGIQFRRQIEWNLGEIALLSTARALKKRLFTKKIWERRELVPKFSFGEDLHRRSSRGSRGADVRLGDDSGANKGGNCERHFYYLCCVCVYEVFSLRVGTLKRAFRKRLKTLFPFFAMMKKSVVALGFFFLACFWMEGVS